MRNLAIIPARSGSKGLPDKNIKLLNGKPLLWYSVEAAKKSNMFSEVMVSTDSEKYAEIAKKQGAKVPFLRSEATSSDTAGSWDAVIEVLEKYHNLGEDFDTICLLQPTSPLRTSEDIIRAYDFFREKRANAVTSVCEVDHSPLWCMILDDNLSLDQYNKCDENLPRQMHRTYYRLNGAIYIKAVQYINDKVNLLNNNDFAYIMPRERSIDIDKLLDFMIAEYLMENK